MHVQLHIKGEDLEHIPFRLPLSTAPPMTRGTRAGWQYPELDRRHGTTCPTNGTEGSAEVIPDSCQLAAAAGNFPPSTPAGGLIKSPRHIKSIIQINSQG